MATLEIRGITKKFGGVVALDKVDLTAESGSVVGIIGPNGSGKTTLLNVITGVYTADDGQILMDGKEIQNLPPEQVCEAGIARTFQNIRLFGTLSVLDNVMVGGFSRQKSSLAATILRSKSFQKDEKAMRDKAVECLEFVGLADKKDLKVENLTYAQQRFLEIARALASDPKILLLDEPAAGMNSAEIEHLMDVIKRIGATGTTLMLIEHIMGLVRGVTDQVMVLNYGERIALGPYAEIESNPLVVEAYLGKGASMKC